MLCREIDNRELQCPQPVINTKKALEDLAQQESEEFVLTVIVDNEAAKENVSRFAESAGYKVEIEQKEDVFLVIIRGNSGKEVLTNQESFENDTCIADSSLKAQTIFLIKSSTLGEGSKELGEVLMRSFIYTLKDSSSLPAKLLFLNSGVYLTIKGSPVLEELQELEKKGTEIFSCGTCLDYYELKDKLQVGKVTNMYETLENISSASRCITLS